MRLKKQASIRVRIEAEHKRVLQDSAAAAGLDLSSWLRSVAIKEAERSVKWQGTLSEMMSRTTRLDKPSWRLE